MTLRIASRKSRAEPRSSCTGIGSSQNKSASSQAGPEVPGPAVIVLRMASEELPRSTPQFPDTEHLHFACQSKPNRDLTAVFHTRMGRNNVRVFMSPLGGGADPPCRSSTRLSALLQMGATRRHECQALQDAHAHTSNWTMISADL